MSLEICRICGSNDNLRHIQDGGAALLEKLSLCASIMINYDDMLPKHICLVCEQGLEFSYRLRKQGEETERRLRQELDSETNSMKIEQSQIQEEEYITIYEDDAGSIIQEDEEEIIKEMSSVTASFESSYYTQDDVLEVYETLAADAVVESEAEEYLEDDLVEEEFIDEDSTICMSIVEEAQLSIDLDDNFDKEKVLQTAESCNEPKPTKTKVESYVCETCQETLPTTVEYRNHIRQHGKQRFHCIQCNKWFATRFRYQKHELCHQNDVDMQPCPHCEKSYRDRSNLVRHIRAVHDRQRLFTCTVCSQSFGRADVLKNHMATHEEARNFGCKQCEQSFKSQRYLDSHMRRHQTVPDNSRKRAAREYRLEGGKKTYHCAECGKISKHHFTHKNHLRTHTLERPYECDTCAKKFATMAALLTHQRIHRDLRPYQCELCLVSFRQHAHLKEHRLIHAGIMKHKCNFCDMAFTKKSNMIVHQRVHTGERPFKCAKCVQQFTKLSLLKRHAATVHGNVVDWENDTQEERVDHAEDKMQYSGESLIVLDEDTFASDLLTKTSDNLLNNVCQNNAFGIGAEETATELIVDDDANFNSLYILDDSNVIV